MSKHVDVRQEYSAASRILNSLASRCLEIWSNKFFRVWYVTSTMLLSLSTGTKYCLWSPYIKHDYPSNILIERLSLVVWLKCTQHSAHSNMISLFAFRETFKGTQLAHMRIRYHSIYNLHITETQSILLLTKCDKNNFIGWAKTHSKTGFSVNDRKSTKTLRSLKRNSRSTLISGWGELFSKWDIAQNAIVFSDMYLQCPGFQCAE